MKMMELKLYIWRQKRSNVFAKRNQIACDSWRYKWVFRFGKKNNSFYPCKFTIGVGYVSLVLKIAYRS